MLEARQAIALDQRQGALACFADRDAGNFHAERNIVEHGAPWQQQVLLQHVTDLTNIACDILAIDQHAPCGGLLQASDDIEEGALAAARGANERDETSCRHDKIGGREGREFSASGVKHHGEMFENEFGH